LRSFIALAVSSIVATSLRSAASEQLIASDSHISFRPAKSEVGGARDDAKPLRRQQNAERQASDADADTS
jgi:hypothetical protein